MASLGQGSAESEQRSPSEHWMMYSDLMAALLLIFALLLSFMMFMARNQQQEAVDLSKELEQRNVKMQERFGIRKRIIESLRVALAGHEVEIDKTGAIIIADKVLFDEGSYDVYPEGKEVIDDVMVLVADVLFSNPEFKGVLSRIIIEGYTNDNGGYAYNFRLSQRRAESVVLYVVQESEALKEHREVLELKLVGQGRSLNDLKYHDDGSVDKERSRRIEVKFALVDEETTEKMREMFSRPLSQASSVPSLIPGGGFAREGESARPR